MAKTKKLHPKPRIDLLKLSSHCTKACFDAHHDKTRPKASEKKEWDNTLCSVCLEFPHNAVLLLCSSHEMGCRPYMCATSHRYSNCLQQYKKAYTKDTHFSQEFEFPDEKTEIPELLCPLCRGQVKGWTVVDPARRYFNSKKRNCMQDNCSFIGTYKEIKKHVKTEHPLARPRDVDPSHAEKWKKLENERDLNDVLTTIRSTMPDAVVMGDYVIDRNYRGDEYMDDMMFRFSTNNFEGSYDYSLDEDFGGNRRVGNNFSGISRRRPRLWVPRRGGRARPHR